MLAKATEGAIMLPMASKRVKNAKWDDRETMLLAKLKREAFLQGEEGSHVWHDISQRISGRSAKQCRRRWDTLVKVYNHVQDYCTQTGQDHEELDDAELASMKLETAYRRDWYMIVQEVSSERKRRRICGLGAAAVLSKGSRTAMEILPTTHPATTAGPDPLDDERETEDVTDKAPPEIEHVESEPVHSGLLDECPNDAQGNGAETEDGGTFGNKTGVFIFDEKPSSPIPENIDLSLFMSKMSLSTAKTIGRISASTVSEGTITRQSSDPYTGHHIAGQ